MRTIFRTTQILSLILIGIFFIRMFFIQYACSKIEHPFLWTDRDNQFKTFSTVENEHGCNDPDLLMLSIYQFLGLAFILLLINRYSTHALKNYDNYLKDYLGFRPKWLLNANLGVRRIFSLLTNVIILIGIFSVLIFLVSCYGKLFVVKLLWDDCDIEKTWTGIFFGVSAIYILLYGILGLFFWVFKGFREKQNSR